MRREWVWLWWLTGILCCTSLSAPAKIKHPWLWFPAMRAEALVSAMDDDRSIVGVFEFDGFSPVDIWHTGNRNLERRGIHLLHFRHHVALLKCLDRLKGESIPEHIFLWIGERDEAIQVTVNDRHYSMLIPFQPNRYILALERMDGNALLPDMLDMSFLEEELAGVPEEIRRKVMDPSRPKQFLPLEGIKGRVYGLAGNRMGSLPFHENIGRGEDVWTCPEKWEDNPFVQDVSGLIRLWRQWHLKESGTDGFSIQFEPQTEFGQIFLECLQKRISPRQGGALSVPSETGPCLNAVQKH